MAELYCWPMKTSTAIRTGRHCVFNMHVHLVFITKYRLAVFTKAMLTSMKNIIGKVYCGHPVILLEVAVAHQLILLENILRIKRHQLIK